MIDITEINKDTVEIELKFDRETEDPKDCFDDPETVTWILDQLDRGNDWAWFVFKIQVSYMDFTGESLWLGRNSYESKRDFMRCDIYTELLNEALEDLKLKIQEFFTTKTETTTVFKIYSGGMLMSSHKTKEDAEQEIISFKNRHNNPYEHLFIKKEITTKSQEIIPS